MKRHKKLSRIFLILILLISLAMQTYQPLIAEGEVSAEIYLNGVSGNDANDGSAKETAVKTFARAKELATAYQSVTSIYITGTVQITGEISLEGTNAVLKREASTNGYLLQVASGAEATLKNITLDGNSEQAAGATNALINCLGTLNIEEGTVLQNNKIASETQRRSNGGGAVYCNGSKCTVNMTGGIIQNNTAMHGGGVFVYKGAKFNMSGGTIQNNQAISGPTAWNDAAAGGGVCVSDGGTFNLSGGLIQNNSAEEVGGGVSIGTLEVSLGNNYLNMTGGAIDGNTSGATGGGIFIQAAYGNRISRATITAGSVTNNSMLGEGETNFLFGGGGIYVNGYAEGYGFKNGELFLENVIVTDNEAEIAGGGYAACPVSNTEIYLTDGGAIYQNRAESAEDVFIYSNTSEEFGAHGGNPRYFVSNTMLGCLPYHWKDDSGTEVPLNKLTGILTGEGVALALHTDETGSADTQNLAKVFITGNYSATRGGGIGTNGNVTIGKTDATVEVRVTKNWDDEGNIKEIRPEKIEVELWRGLKDVSVDLVYVGYETIIPDENGDWSITFINLPKYDYFGNECEYTVRERKISGYLSEVTGDQTAGYEIKNSLAPDTVNVEGKKEWADNDAPDGKRPESITIRLLKNGVETDFKTVTAADGWKWSFVDLPASENGVEIVYTISEDPIPDYSAEITGYDVKNTYIPSKINIPVTKVWEDSNDVRGYRPISITVRLLSDNNTTGMSLVLNQDNDWSGVFSDLPEYNNGVKIVYTVEEVKLNYYDSVVSGDANKGFVITNYFNPPPPPETTAPETTEPSETTAPETTEPPETTALETTEPPETTVPETTDPTETTAPETETSTPPETTTSESTEPPETIAIETTEPPETTVSETTEPPETQVESTPVTDLHAPQTGENKTLFIRAALVIISAGVLFLLFANKKKKLN
ncbi:MAG TPA: Cna B-type domain-containing protein [Clostridiales bacterium]|nr:Cna B-type domain-containing protein [Clostridiales bacterium]